MSATAGYSYEFEHYRLSVSGEGVRLYSGRLSRQLNAHQARALRILVENHDRLVEKETLLNYVYGELNTNTDEDLRKIIYELRQKLADISVNSEIIKTERGRGYRFIAKVTRVPYVSFDDDPAKEPLQPIVVAGPVLQTLDGETPATANADSTGSSLAAYDAPSVTADSTDDGMNTFGRWLIGPGRATAMILLACVVLVIALSVWGLTSEWSWTNSYVSIAQLCVLLFALMHRLRGPKGFKATGDTLTRDIRNSTGYDDPDKWRHASSIAEKVLKRYKLYWQGILVTWFLLYASLTLTGLPVADLNCQINASRFCVGGLAEAGRVAVQLQHAEIPPSGYLSEKLSPEARKMLMEYRGSSPPSRELERAVVEALNRALKDWNLYPSNRAYFDGRRGALSAEALDIIGQEREQQLSDEPLARFNLSLLHAAYPDSRPDLFSQHLAVALRICTTLFNNGSSLMIFLCFNILNKPTEIKSETGGVSDNYLSVGGPLVVGATLIEIILAVNSPSPEKLYSILQWWSWGSGIFGGLAMALYIGRLQSKFLEPPRWLVILLYLYTVIQSLFVFLEERQEGAVALMDFALMMKCLLFLYMLWLIKSGRLLFYLVRVRRTYQGVIGEFGTFRGILDEEGSAVTRES